jgi:hypothetical protein
MSRPLFTPGKDPVTIVQEAGWAPGPVWTGAENLAPTGIQSLDRPACSQSLYRLCYPAHTHMYETNYICWIHLLHAISHKPILCLLLKNMFLQELHFDILQFIEPEQEYWHLH